VSLVPPSVLQQEFGLVDLVDAKSLADVCRSFSELYRVGLKIFDAQGNKLVDVKVGNADFCGYIWEKPQGRAQCIATVGRVKGEPVREDAPTTFQCFSGCRYVVVPLLYQGDAIGRVVFGPFVPDDLRELPRTLTSIAPDFDASRAGEAIRHIRRAPQAMADQVVRHFAQVLEVLAFQGHKNVVTARLHIEAVQESYRELQEKNRAIEESYSKLRELDRLKSNFIGTMSHELRTPLTSVIGYSEMMLEGLGGPLTKEQREYLSIIMEKGDNLLQLITSILDITKIEAGRVRLVLSEVDVAPFVADAAATILPHARKKGIALSADVGRDLPRMICDREKLRQALLNLLSNSLKFTPPGGFIRAGAQALPGERIAMWVQDSGIGIAEEHLGRVFDVFYQVDGSNTREYGGAGLGLAIVKSFAEAHGGEVQLQSKPGEGSTFTLVLPREVPAAKVRAGHPTPLPLPASRQ
jgi:two-component system sensor histidine kinase BarA